MLSTRFSPHPPSPQPLSLRTNISWTFIGNFIYAACQWGIIVLLTKLGTARMVGVFALALAVSTPVFMLFNLQLRGIQATDANRQYTFRDYFLLRSLTTLLALASMPVVLLIAHYPWDEAKVILVVSLGKALDAMSEVFYGLFQQRETMDRIAKPMILNGVFSVVTMGVVLKMTGSLVWGTAGWVFGSAIALAYIVPCALLRERAESNPLSSLIPTGFATRPQLRRIARLAWLSLPLGLVLMVITLNSNIPRYFIERILGARDLGVFAALYYTIAVGTVVVTALGHSASPKLARFYADSQIRSFVTLVAKLIVICWAMSLAMSLAAYLGGRHLITLMYNREYAHHSGIFVQLTLVAGVIYTISILGYALTAARYISGQLVLHLLVTLFTTAACWFFIPRYGLMGAVYSIWVAALTQVLGSVVILAGLIQQPGPTLRNLATDPAPARIRPLRRSKP